MKINRQGIELIKKYEGCPTKNGMCYSYKCPAGILTIGYGHTGKDVKPNMTITKEKADELLLKDLEKFEKIVEKYDSTYHFNSNEFSALVSFAYNIGNIDGLTSKSKRTKQQIIDAFPKYCYANGQRLLGLVNRRNAELQLFKQPIIEDGSKVVKVIAPSGLNLRDGWSVNSNKITAVPFGTYLEFIENVNSDWCKVKYNNKICYCSRKWVI